MIIKDLAGILGTWEIIIIFAAILLLFGGKKIPELMKGIGKGIREFNEAKERVKADFQEGMNSKDDKKETTNSNTKTD
jgi:sec-independent protein translocase protein TatA